MRRIFVVAQNFHGATLLGRLLNGHPKVVSLADTYPSNAFDQICGCGARVSECRFWQIVKERVAAERYRDYPLMLPMYPKITGGVLDRALYNCIAPKRLGRRMAAGERRVFVEDYDRFLEAVYAEQGKSNAEVFVDGVKSIARVIAFVAAGADVDGVIHLIRDPGDFAKSSMKQAKRGLGGLVGAGVRWRAYHNRARRLGRYVPYVRVSYEELTDRTDATLGKLFDFLGVPRFGVKDLLGDPAGVWHFMGNASLFGFDGQVWRRTYELGPAERLLVRISAGRSRD